MFCYRFLCLVQYNQENLAYCIQNERKKIMNSRACFDRFNSKYYVCQHVRLFDREPLCTTLYWELDVVGNQKETHYRGKQIQIREKKTIGLSNGSQCFDRATRSKSGTSSTF